MNKQDAIDRLCELKGRNLHELAKEYDVTVTASNGKVNKGWAGHVFERHLCIPLNSSNSPNMGSWELKSIPLKYLRNGKLSFKETMAITMIDYEYTRQTEFENSHLLAKINKSVVVARTVGELFSEPSYVHSVTEITIDNELYDAVKADYNLVRNALLNHEELTGRMGYYIQPRTKGPGGPRKSRAFYARPRFLKHFISLEPEPD